MCPAEVLVVEGARLRVGPWRGDHETAYVTPAANAAPCDADAARQAVETLARRGYRRVVTAALAPLDQIGFLAAGFEVREHLHLLSLDLTQGLPRDLRIDVRTRRARRRDHDAVLSLDHQAFGGFWQLDHGGLTDALTATPVSRFRVVDDAGLAGYTIVGRAGRRGYIQRLAVHPERQGRGIGTSLLGDGLRWLRRRGVRVVLVNTQESNADALALYEGHGFERQPGGLAVLAADVS